MDKQEVKIYDNPLIKNLQQGITQTGSFEVAKIDKLQLNLELKQYKNGNGSVNFAALRQIPVDKRLYAMAKNDLGQTIKIIAVAITLAMETMNLSRPMTSFQILDLSEIIAEQSSENDNLSLQDLLLFLQKLTRGEYPGLYEGMDIPKFLERFNNYRDERWNEFIRLRDEKNEEYKRLGEESMFDRMYKKPETAFEEHLRDYSKKIMAKNDEIKELRKKRN